MKSVFIFEKVNFKNLSFFKKFKFKVKVNKIKYNIKIRNESGGEEWLNCLEAKPTY